MSLSRSRSQGCVPEPQLSIPLSVCLVTPRCVAVVGTLATGFPQWFSAAIPQFSDKQVNQENCNCGASGRIVSYTELRFSPRSGFTVFSPQTTVLSRPEILAVDERILQFPTLTAQLGAYNYLCFGTRSACSSIFGLFSSFVVLPV